MKPPADAWMRRLTDDDVLHHKLLRDGDDGIGDLALALDESALEQLGELLRLGPCRARSPHRAAKHHEHGAEPAEPPRQTARAADERAAALRVR